MSEVRLVIREAERDWSGTIHGSCAAALVAALSADPVTLEELETAVSRFEKPIAPGQYFGGFSIGINDKPHDAGLVVIELVARLVVVESTYFAPQASGTVPYHDGRESTGIHLSYRLADDWLLVNDASGWRRLAEDRRRARAETPVLDARPVLYGAPLLEFVAREIFAAYARREAIAAATRAKWVERARQRLARVANVSPRDIDPSRLTDEEITPKCWPGDERDTSSFYDAIKDIHAAWLLTPREDLRGACPREVMRQQRSHIDRDLQDRCDQWSQLDECPPGLERSSFAYRHGGLGMHEAVIYYDLVRELLWSSWDRLTELSPMQAASEAGPLLTLERFVDVEVPRLQAFREQWLDTPKPERHLRTPRSVTDRERARLPESVSGHEAMIDPECPCCQLLGDMPGPIFWHLDGSEMDDEFAFDLCHATREEWEEEQRRWEEHSRRFDEEMKERDRLGVRESSSSIWSSSYSVGNITELPLGARLFSIGCHLAELMMELRGEADREATPQGAQQLIEQLNRDFGNLRELLNHSEPSLAEALIKPLLARFGETLTEVARQRPDLGERCEALESDLGKLLDEPPSPREWESLDSDIPY